MNLLSKLFGLLSFTSLVAAFSPQHKRTSNPIISRKLSIMAANKPSGSFFNQIPDKDDNANDGENETSDMSADPFEESLNRMMKSRSEKKSKQPSTIGGVPTSGIGTFFTAMAPSCI